MSTLKPIKDEVVYNKWKIVLALMAGALGGFAARRPRPANVMAASEFEAKFHELFENEDIRTLLIFGYTSETVRDYQKYEHLYVEGLEIRVLNRSWLAEQADEDTHNEKIKHLKMRPWNKSETIHQMALSPWTYKAHREVRYYDFCHPIIKGAILKTKKSAWAFVNFYEWQEVPSQGGSVFKGADLGMIFLDSSRPQERIKIVALESQFELIWKYRSYPLSAINPHYKTYIPPV